MARPKIKSELQVLMNGIDVGLLTRTSTGQLRFEYSKSWFSSPESRPLSMSLPFTSGSHIGEVVENFFENLLPDSKPIRERIQTKFGAASNKGFDLLWHVGGDCVGAIQILPANQAIPDVYQVQSVTLSEGEIAAILRNYKTMPLGMDKDGDFRISIAGAQEKTALLYHNGKWHRPEGATPTSHIFKLPIGRIEHSGMDLTDSVENEFICHLMLKEFGIPVAHSEIQIFEDMKVLVVERFDRRWSSDKTWLMRLPQEDMCQALNVPPALKYECDGGPSIEDIMQFLLGSTEPVSARRRFMKTQFLFWLMGAIDGHAKNFSVFLLPGGRYTLTPSYDVMSAYPLLEKGQLLPQKIKMAMAVRGKSKHYHWERILCRHWLSTAKVCHFPEEEMETIMSEVFDQMDGVIERVTDQITPIVDGSLIESVAKPIFSHMKSIRGGRND